MRSLTVPIDRLSICSGDLGPAGIALRRWSADAELGVEAKQSPIVVDGLPVISGALRPTQIALSLRAHAPPELAVERLHWHCPHNTATSQLLGTRAPICPDAS